MDIERSRKGKVMKIIKTDGVFNFTKQKAATAGTGAAIMPVEIYMKQRNYFSIIIPLKIIALFSFTTQMVELWSQSKQEKGCILVRQRMIMGNYRF